jgi:hypothetical protein
MITPNLEIDMVETRTHGHLEGPPNAGVTTDATMWWTVAAVVQEIDGRRHHSSECVTWSLTGRSDGADDRWGVGHAIAGVSRASSTVRSLMEVAGRAVDIVSRAVSHVYRASEVDW